MPPIHIASTSRALYRVFIAPTLTIPLRPQPSILIFSTPTLLPITTTRPKSYKKPAVRHALSDHFTYDSAITSPRINMVDASGVFRNNISLSTAQSSFNRTTHHLVQLTEGKVDEYGHPDLEDLPTCKVISKMDLRAQHQKKLDLERRQSKGLGVGPSTKNLELNWAIAGGDLKHRLGKMKEFLTEGRKVEILFGAKRRGRVANKEECEALMASVRSAVEECKGASQVKEPEGVVGGVLTMFFQGRRLEGAGERKEEARKGRRKSEQEREGEEKEKEAAVA
ncbi:hypothetical protein K505DRAFT_321206 [Melanomma pulvis-pyrius CBS 109.77]|uniref:Translation initiation factor 3 N-terminal domain-containing protein n=1 Tax=Melanomma pulvis-pyrius CBS 109.77 TaxID=1314802 RepID=A0A6A6XRW8_9PLEO|nr:hypothetical protein K505DRAFT_321206 [Melanomma pulvis-pyrius CBS 109.77]